MKMMITNRRKKRHRKEAWKEPKHTWKTESHELNEEIVFKSAIPNDGTTKLEPH